MKNSKQLLRNLGVYGFDHLELVIIASLVSEDPLLLIGKAGTGKTYLLNSLSEALGLEHRHYNASFLSFDDLVGFPYPDSNGESVSFLKTPATIWGAESVLIDELSRCKPEIQNKFFSVIHEKKLQGIGLDKLRYRWAAMNPIVSENSDSDDFYEGSISLDQALADRFAFIIEVPDWNELTTEEQELVIYPAGEGATTGNSNELINLIAELRPKFLNQILTPTRDIITYCRIISTLLGNAGLRISPRRARLLARNFTALFLVAKSIGFRFDEKSIGGIFKSGLRWSLPHRAWKSKLPDNVIDAAHAECIKVVLKSNQQERWLTEFLLAPTLPAKINMLLEDPVSREAKSLAVLQLIRQKSPAQTAVFAFSAQPILADGNLIDDEALNALTSISIKIMKVDGQLEWREPNTTNKTKHPSWSSCVHYINSLPDDQPLRKIRAKQLLLYLLCNSVAVPEPEFIETQLNDCFKMLSGYYTSKNE